MLVLIGMAVRRALGRTEHRADGSDRRIEPLGDLAVGALELARLHQRRVELIGEPRAVGAERLDPRRQLVLVAVGLAPPLDRALQRVQRGHEPPRCGFDIRGRRFHQTGMIGRTIVHAARRRSCLRAKSAVRQALMARSLRAPTGQRNAAAKLCTTKQLLRAARRWTRGTKVLSAV